tara:strand:+ start:1041 stop:1295 length:255 start_codon:yes stop_codon:yes gene_type:complete
MKTFKEMRQDDINEAKDFNRVQEVNGVKKIDKLLEQAYKGMNKLQYGKSLYMMEVNDGIVVARRALNKYKEIAANGELDGPIQK